MIDHTKPARGAATLALCAATCLAGCKTNEPELMDAGDPEWRVSGAVDPDSLPDPAPPGASGAQFLEMNKSREGVVVLPSGLQYRVLEQGNGAVPGLEDTVLVHYKMMNLDGEVVDDSRERGSDPESFRVARVIGGWREALLRMPEGSRWKLYVPSDLGYGSMGVAGVAPNETLIYEIELFKVAGAPSDPSADDAELDPQG